MFYKALWVAVYWWTVAVPCDCVRPRQRRVWSGGGGGGGGEVITDTANNHYIQRTSGSSKTKWREIIYALSPHALSMLGGVTLSQAGSHCRPLNCPQLGQTAVTRALWTLSVWPVVGAVCGLWWGSDTVIFITKLSVAWNNLHCAPVCRRYAVCYYPHTHRLIIIVIDR